MLGVIAFTALSQMGKAALMFYILVYIFSNLAAFGVICAENNNLTAFFECTWSDSTGKSRKIRKERGG